MSKLESKLIELGYRIYFKEHKSINTCAIKDVNGYDITILINKPLTQITDYEITLDGLFSIQTQQDINALQQAFNQLQKDLETLREVKPT